MRDTRSSFSVEYLHPARPDEICAVDWDHWERGRWIRSSKEKDSIYWCREGDLDELAYEGILKKFGLEDYKAELPLNKIQGMSPSELMKYRQVKGLPQIVVKSDTPGDYRSAEEY